jgi:hypothetical protein
MLLIYPAIINKEVIRLINKTKICYLGFDYKVKNRLIDMGMNVLDISLLLSKVSNDIKYDFIDYIASIGELQNNKELWWATRIASKSNLQTDFYSMVCLIMVAKQIIEENDCDVFIVTNPWVYFILKHNFTFYASSLSKMRASIDCLVNILINIVKFPLARFYWLVKLIIKNIKFKKYVREEVSSRSNFVYSWVEERSFEDDGTYNDPYLKGLGAFKSQLPLVRFIPYYVSPSLYPYLKMAEQNFTGLPYYSNTSIIIKSLFAQFKIRYNSDFKGLDLSYLWVREILKENCDSHCSQQSHDYQCWRKFARKAKGKLIYPYENQPWEKMMIMASGAEHSELKLIGYQHSSIGNILLNYHTTPKELSLLPIPDMIVVNSTSNQDILGKYYENSDLEVINGGALRYSGHMEINHSGHKKKRVGIMLPSGKNQAYDLLTHMNSRQIEKFDIIVKPHPDLPIKKSDLKSGLELFSGTAEDLYSIVDGIIYCSSTSGLEAYSLGIPVFRYLGNFIDLQMGEDLFTPKLIRSIHDISESDLSFQTPKRIFSPVNFAVWQDLLK